MGYGNYLYWWPFTISGATLIQRDGASRSGLAQGGGLVGNLVARSWALYNYGGLTAYKVNGSTTTDASVASGGSTTGGNQILPYKTSSPYNMFCLAKASGNILKYNILTENLNTFVGNAIAIATLGTGFDDFCGCSEAQNIGDPELVHMVYIKSTGELCYNNFENDELGVEKVLVASGASYPVVAVGKGGKLYVLYVKSGKVWVIYNWLSPVELFTQNHTYNNPAYLSCNQNVQTGLICLVWTEGATSPYAVWFCYLED